MYRSHNCGALTIKDLNKNITLSGWVHRIRDKGFIIWVDIRDRYGVTQLIFDEKRSPNEIFKKARKLGREFIIKVKGDVIEREAKNPNIKTGAVEILVKDLSILNESLVPPFTIEDHTDGGEELRMQFRYLDIRRNPVKEKLIFRSKVTMLIREYLIKAGFIDIETPYLIKSTPEGARDFIVPSRSSPGQFYALPQSPQTFKQLLMVGGIDKYFQIVKCFRDEDLRADRQPEFTQIDCEMSFVQQDDILIVFENLVKYLFKEIKGIDVVKIPRMTFDQAMEKYGTDKPDIRFGMTLTELNNVVQGKGFEIFDNSDLVVGIVVPGAATFSRKEIDGLIEWVKRPQVGAKGMIWLKLNPDQSFKSSVDKFYTEADFKLWKESCKAKPGDLIFVLAGETNSTRFQISSLRMELAERLGMRDPKIFAPVWVTDFPLFKWDKETKHYQAIHHPFTAPKPEHLKFLEKDPSSVKASAYDLIINGNEVGGGSIRIHDQDLQSKIFDLLGFSKKDASEQFGFLMEAFSYGAPPHGGIAFGLDRLIAILAGEEIIRDFIAFPKNNSGKDIMINAPSHIDPQQMKELSLKIDITKSE